MFEVKVYTAYDTQKVPKEILKDYKYVFQDGGNVLAIYVDGELKDSYADRGEPEDNSFIRDYSWIKNELESAFTLGFAEGYKRKNA